MNWSQNLLIIGFNPNILQKSKVTKFLALFLYQKTNLLSQLTKYLFFGILFFFCLIFDSFAFEKSSNNSKKLASLPPTLRANRIFGDQKNNTIDAIGNVELVKDDNTILSDKMTYDRGNNIIKAYGNVQIINYQNGNVIAEYADVKDDLTSGHFDQAKIVFFDGSYLTSPQITKTSKTKTILDKSIFSICPNEEIAGNNNLAGKKSDMISIKTRKTTIDRDKENVQLDGAIIRIHNIPVMYTPILSIPFPSSKRKTGFLTPSYIKTTRLGIGLIVPYYFNIAPNRDLTTTAELYPSGSHVIINNEFRHLLKQGEYKVNMEVANNNVKPLNTVDTTTTSTQNSNNNSSVRWRLKSQGDFQLEKNYGLEFVVDRVEDKDYLRDYRNNYVDNTLTTVNLDYIKNRNYYSAKTVAVQEIGIDRDSSTAPIALPVLNAYVESKPGAFNQKYSILGNSTVISRENGLQYRRISATPEVKLPYNLKGNLFEAAASMQTDFYNMENNFSNPTPNDNNFKSTATNYRPQISLNWSLPLVNRLKKSTIIIEPMINIADSAYKNNFNKIPNEDSNDIELTQNNLFLNDRFYGFDRSESGKKASYGAKSSLFNSFGQFGLGLGQSIRNGYKPQDVNVRGFNANNKSNIVGEIFYRSKKSLYIDYIFDLNESNYNNEINQVIAVLDFDRFSVNTNYLLLKPTMNNPTKREQFNFGSNIKVTNHLAIEFSTTRDLVNGREISRKIGFTYTGCCLVYGISMSESNPANFAKPQQSFNFILTVKSL